MKSIILATTLALGLTAAAGLANAAPISTSAAKSIAAQDSVTTVAQKRGERFAPKRGWGPKRNYRAGGRYSRPPGGWRRHSHRPSDWSRRGCIIVGPIWYCP